MNASEWTKARSDFNHAWLKNRVLVAIAKARKVLDGYVRDDRIWEDLRLLLQEWPERLHDALGILNSIGDATTQIDFLPGLFVEDAITRDFLSDLSRRRSVNTDEIHLDTHSARSALFEMDTAVIECGAHLPNQGEILPEDLHKSIQRLEAKSRAVAHSFSELNDKMGPAR